MVFEKGPIMRANTNWFRDAKWGVFCHYLAADQLTPEQWNAQVDAFDVKALADQLESAEAPYICLTLGQNSGHYCSPNAAYDRFVGINPSKCSRRDLVADLYDELHPRGIELLVYLPSGAPDRDPVAMEKLEWKNGSQPDYARPPHGLDAEGRPWGSVNPANIEFQKKWEQVIAEWSKRWGAKVRGWWFDGCYFADAMYRRPEPPNFASFAAAAKAGNPQSLVAFNPGVLVPIISMTEHEDYTAGEISRALPECSSRWVDGAQLQILTYLGQNWCSGEPRFSDELVIAYTRYVNSKEGVITWDVPIEPSGLIPEPFVRQLRAIGKSV